MPKYLTTSSGRKILLNTPAEDAAITAAAMSDPDAVPLSDQEWEAVKPTLRRGRPPAAITKQALTVRYDADVVAAFKAMGPGWQTRMNAALREWLEAHERR